MNSEIAFLKRTAKVKSLEGGRAIIGYLDQEVTLAGAGAELFGRILPHLDGIRTISEIAGSAREEEARVSALARQLSKAGVLSIRARVEPGTIPAGMMSGLEFHELHRRYAGYWLRPVYEHPFWERVMTGTATRAQIIGFAFEKYHYIEGAHEHMGIAAANATPEMMPHLARHFIEEYTHGDIYRKGLSSLFPDKLILKSQPLPSTRALVNYLTETAARSSFAYYAGNEVLQMTENTADQGASDSIDDFYAAMRKNYPFSGKLIDSFIAHTRADQKLGHSDVFKEMCESIPPLTRREVVDAMNVAKSMAEHLLLFMDGIDVWYGKNDLVPRVPCALLSE